MTNVKDDVTQEDHYFHREDKSKLDRLKAQVEAEKAAAAKEERRLAHWHRCGKCGAEMRTQVFRGVEIEVCPECGAVLLDNGELETLAGKDATGAFSVLGELFRFSRKQRDFALDDDRLS